VLPYPHLYPSGDPDPRSNGNEYMTEKTLHIGLDDTDSARRGCTTYIAGVLIEELEKLGVRFFDYPNLVRLNPNVPWKTRGNGALCLRIRYPEELEEQIKKKTLNSVERYSDLESKGTDPGVVFFGRPTIPREVRVYATRAITGVVKLNEALDLLTRYKAEALGFKNGRGIIGALAAVGETLQEDHTYEILAYRAPKNWGTKRRVDETSIFQMDKETAPCTFNNVDTEKGRVIITPRGPDPILFGIRGETAEAVKKAFQIVKPLETVERWVIFRTNQGTDAHLRRVSKLSVLAPYSSVIVMGTVSAAPSIVTRRHAIFSIKDENAEVDCAAFEPTGALRRTAMKLMVGDSVEASGAVKTPSRSNPLTINLEKIRVTKLEPKLVYQNPPCPNCGKRLKSMGKNQGLRCEKCGFKRKDSSRIQVRMKRDLKKGIYITSTRSQRHLTKPLTRYGMEKRSHQGGELIDEWHFP
jgi:tRNA(Ile2)-agmatinylcytidine synthase